jgi:hypothetical protein
MGSIRTISDHAAAALGRLATQFRESPRLKGFITVVANEVQACENAFNDMRAQLRDYTVAADDALDKIGNLIGAPVRGPRNNVDYRLRIAAQILTNRSSGEGASLYGIAKGIVAGWNVVGQPKLVDCVPAHATMKPVGAVRNIDAQARELAQVLNGSREHPGAASAGVRIIVFSRPDTVAEGGFFRFAGGAGPPQGFGVGNFISAYDK